VRYRVEELAARADVSVDTIRYYQARDLLPPPARAGRLAWYGDEHLDRLARIRRWQARGLSLAVIRRLLNGDLDQADERLVAAVAQEDTGGAEDGPATWLTLGQVAQASGIPPALLEAIRREGLLVPRRVGGEDRYTGADVEAVAAGLSLLGHGLPLPELLGLARDHDAAMRAVAQRAVDLFDRHVRHRLRDEGLPDDEAATQLVAAFEALLPATLAIVAHHFRRTLLSVAQDHIERVGSEDEVRMVSAQADRPLAEASWTP
jgi:DNA-binding transcriptional MerR regulator